MKVVDVEQGSAAWFRARSRIVTASELGNILTTEAKPRKRDSEMVRSYLARKVAEAWLGEPIGAYSSPAMEQGSILEREALPWYALTYDVEVKRPGLFVHDDGNIGASPDGWMENGTGLEIKCPLPHTHVRWLIDGVVPEEHLLQCEAGMYVTGAPHWTFVSYCRNFPALVVKVERDEDRMTIIDMVAEDFAVRFHAAMSLLERMDNGARAARLAQEAKESEHPF